MTPPDSPTPEEVAAVCRAKLHQSLLVTSQLLRMESTPAESLLARMNDLLTAVVDTNFGSATRDQVRCLYAAIARLQPTLIDHCEHLALLYLARSLAVVIEEAVRQKEQLTATLEQDARHRDEEEEAMRSALIADAVLQQQEPQQQQQQREEKLPEASREELSGAVEGYGSEQKKNEEEYGCYAIDNEWREEQEEQQKREYGSYTGQLFESIREKMKEMEEKKVEEYGSQEVTVADQCNCGEARRNEDEAAPPLSPWEQQKLTMHIPSVEEKDQFLRDYFESAEEVPELPEDKSYVYTTLPEELEKMGEEEMKGVLTIHGVSPHIGQEQLGSFLEMFGTLHELRHYPKWEGWLTGFAMCRYESEEVARGALARLNTKMFFGTELHVRSLSALLPRLKREESAPEADHDATEADERASPTSTDTSAPEADRDADARASPTNTDTSAPEADRDAAGADAARALPTTTDTVALDSDDTDTEAVLDDCGSWGSLDEVD